MWIELTSDNISGKQAVLLLFVSNSYSILNFVPAFSRSVEASARVWGALLSIPFQLILLIPALVLYHRFHGQNVITVAFNRWRPLGYLFASLYLLDFLLQISGNLVSFEYFMTNAVYPNSTALFIILTMGVCCFICARHGFEGIARASSILFFFLLLSSAFICLVSAPNISLFNIRPVLDKPAQSIFYIVLENTSRSIELFLFILLFPKIKGNLTKSAVGFVTSSALMKGITIFVVVGVLGEFALTQNFPYYTLASISDTKLIQRLDSLHMMVWVFTAFVRVTLLAILANETIRMMLPRKLHKATLPVIFVVVVSLALATSNSIDLLRQSNFANTSVIIILLTFLLPLLLLCITKRKGKEKHAPETNITLTRDPE